MRNIKTKQEAKNYIATVIWVVVISVGIVFWISKVAP